MCLAAAVPAQQNRPLNLQLVPVTEGKVVAIRESHVNPGRLPTPAGTPPVGVPSDIEDAPPVGAVLQRPIGRGVPSSEKKWSIGAAGSAEAELGRSGYEVEVIMDDSERRVFRVPDRSNFYVGQRVSVQSGELVPLRDDPPWSP